MAVEKQKVAHVDDVGMFEAEGRVGARVCGSVEYGGHDLVADLL